MSLLTTRAPAKINLTLHVLGRRPGDGYHALESLVAFAEVADMLELVPGPDLALEVSGPTAGPAGPLDDNLVLRAARHLAAGVDGMRHGAFRLHKQLPVAAGIGGGSSDAAALRLLAELNRLPLGHPAVIAAARATGADVPVCLDPRARMMRGAGEEIGPVLDLASLPAVLVNPGVPVATAPVFKALGLAVGQRLDGAAHPARSHRPATIWRLRPSPSPPSSARRWRCCAPRADAASRGCPDRARPCSRSSQTMGRRRLRRERSAPCSRAGGWSRRASPETALLRARQCARAMQKSTTCNRAIFIGPFGNGSNAARA